MEFKEAVAIVNALPPKGSRKLREDEVEAVRLVINSVRAFAEVMTKMAKVFEGYLEAGKP